jgi:hypothetical protein
MPVSDQGVATDLTEAWVVLRTTRNSVEFIKTIHTLQAGPRNILVRLDAVSVFRVMAIEKALLLLNRHFGEAIL